MMSGIVEFLTRLMAGGALEIVLLIVIIVVALILLLVALWLAWKLLVLLGKGIVWLFTNGREYFANRKQAKGEARLTALPAVATGWGSSRRIGLRRALKEAARMTGPDALRIVVVAGDGVAEMCRSLRLSPPGAGNIGIAAGADVVLIDATRTSRRGLARLANALPWRRPADAAVVLVSPEDIPADAVARAAHFARFCGMRMTLHFALPSGGDVSAWALIDAHNNDAGPICERLAVDSASHWLAGGEREGLKEVALAQTRGLAASLGRALVAAPSGLIDVASLALGGTGLYRAAAQTVVRTQPMSAQSVSMWVGALALVAGALLVGLAAMESVRRTAVLDDAIDTAQREASVSWRAAGIDSIPSAARVRRMAGLGVDLADTTSFSWLMPLASVAPGQAAPRELGAAFLEHYMLAPLAIALDRRIRRTIMPSDDPGAWIEAARQAGEWMIAWQGLDEDPTKVDIRRLLVAAFGGDDWAWSEGTDRALERTGARPPAPAAGGLDVDGLTELARENFILTMQRWATEQYINGPVARAARRAADRSATWRDQHAALIALRNGLQDPSQAWLTAPKDRPDHALELPILGRAVALSLIGETTAVSAKAEVSRIRIDAREATDYFVLPDIGPMLVRANANSGGGQALALSREVEAWLAFLDRVANAGFAELPTQGPPLPSGLVTIDLGAVTDAARRIEVFRQFATNLPAELPASVAENLILELTSELVVGLTATVEAALRPVQRLGNPSTQVEHLARAAPAMADMTAIESWLRDRGFDREAERVLEAQARVADGVLLMATDALFDEEPLAIYIDPAADADALVRRFERGIAHLTRLQTQLVEPFVETAAQRGKLAAVAWEDIADDLASHGRGNTDTLLSSYEGMVRAYADDREASCEAPRPAISIGRDDYVARATARFRHDLDAACAADRAARSQSVLDRVARFFELKLAWLWPWARDPGAPEVTPGTLDDYVETLQDAQETLATLDVAVARAFLEESQFWERLEDGGTGLLFRVRWRDRPSEELRAENLIELGIEGAAADEDGVYTWRFGAPFSISMRLALDSNYRFVESDDLDGLRKVVGASGSAGAFLRVLDGLNAGALLVEAWVQKAPFALEDGEDNPPLPLRVSARFTKADGTPLTLPAFGDEARLHLGLGTPAGPPPGTD